MISEATPAPEFKEKTKYDSVRHWIDMALQ